MEEWPDEVSLEWKVLSSNKHMRLGSSVVSCRKWSVSGQVEGARPKAELARIPPSLVSHSLRH